MEAKRTKHDCGVSLPEDIVFDVLTRLLAKTLCRFRCVCKGWRALISDPAFVAAQRSRAADPHLVGVFSGSRHLAEVRVIDMDSNVVKAFKITGSTPQLPTRPDLICADGRGLPYHGGMIIDLAPGRAFAAFGTTDPTPWAMTYTYSTILGRATPSGVFKVLRLQVSFQRDDDDGGSH
ncbi:unnamed protein product [Miscanthus lutarioriparius]|uniref:F-box domain-containing protein n=1 Tax=Miscanthus lutarioriparius TaxID=422564 RepID=A0A811PXU3_9POAL|nr:unnamed protein product [Miscanthus lutarioriparius]